VFFLGYAWVLTASRRCLESWSCRSLYLIGDRLEQFLWPLELTKSAPD